MKYVFKNKLYSIFFYIIDTIGSILFIALRFAHVPKNPKKILVVRLDHIGDFIATTPLLKLLKTTFPSAHVSVAVNSSLESFAATYPYVDSTVAYDAAWFKRPKVKVTWRDIRDLAEKLTHQGFDIAIDPRGDLFSICALTLARIPYRIGYGITGFGFLLHKEVRFDPCAGVIARNINVAPFLELSNTSKILPEVFFSKADALNVDTTLAKQKPNDKKAVVLHPFAGTFAKQWSFDRFQTLVDTLAAQGVASYLIGTKYDVTTLKNVIDFRGEFTLNEICVLIKRAGFFIGLDSGPAHIAIASHVPSVIICSGTNIPQRWLPQADFVKLVIGDCDCRPCSQIVCPKPNHYCMDDITVEDIIEKIKELKY